MKAPEGYENDLSSYGPVLFDPVCGEPIAWGFKILRRLGSSRFYELRSFGNLECVAMGNWVLVVKWLTPEEAVQKYGPVTKGPRGGFRSVTYGNTQFLSRCVKP